MALSDELRIGELAERAGCAPSAVRYYESVGLIEAPERVSGQRRYPAVAVDRLRLILVLRSAGLGIRDLAIALDHSPAGADTRRDAATRRAATLRVKLDDTRRALAILEHGADCTSVVADDAACARDIQRRMTDAGLGPRSTPPEPVDVAGGRGPDAL